jgi:hypothetical protein
MQLSYGSKKAQQTAYSKQQTAKKPRPTRLRSSLEAYIVRLFAVDCLLFTFYV